MPRTKRGGAGKPAPPLEDGAASPVGGSSPSFDRGLKLAAVLNAQANALPRNIFEQIVAPDISTPEEQDAMLSRARVAAVGFAIAPFEDMHEPGQAFWLVAYENGLLWRWAIVDQADYISLCAQRPWIAELEQIFLT